MINPSLQDHVKNELVRLQEKHGFPGATCAYVLSDGTIGEVSCGFADQEIQEPMSPASRMLAASIGKTFVAATVLALANEVRLHLSDPLSSWLGARDWYPRLPNHETITIRHLLTHSAGIKDHVHTKEFFRLLPSIGDHFSYETLIECILDEPPLFEAGLGWAYTDTGYILLGLVIEEATRNTYYEELERRFLKPLKLVHTTASDKRLLPGLVSGYTPKDNPFGLPTKIIDATGALLYNPAIEWTGGGVISTSRNLAMWAKLLYEGHAMHSEYLNELFQSVPISEDASKGRYGAGVAIIPNTPLGEKWGHLGNIPGYISSMRYYPMYKIAIAFQVNTDVDAAKMMSDLEETLSQCFLKSKRNAKESF